MTKTIYLDILVLLNIYVSYFLLIATAKIMSYKINKWRLFSGCIMGGVFSLIILFDLHEIEFILIKILMGVSLVLVTFYSKDKLFLIKSGLYFMATNFIYGGMMFFIWFFIKPNIMTFKNGVAYFDISALMITISTIIAYIFVHLFCYILNKRNKQKEVIDIKISLNGREIVTNGFVDTGNKLVDLLTSLPVVVCEFDEIKDIFSDKTRDYYSKFTEFSFNESITFEQKKNMRVVNINSINGESCFPAFKPDYIEVYSIKKDAVIAVTTKKLSDGSYSAILNTALVQ